jgi:hypothetical protein
MSKNNLSDKEKLEQEYREKEKYNSITNAMHVENQNQTHNAKKEGLGPNTKR